MRAAPAVMADELGPLCQGADGAEREQWCLDNWDMVCAAIGAAALRRTQTRARDGHVDISTDGAGLARSVTTIAAPWPSAAAMPWARWATAPTD